MIYFLSLLRRDALLELRKLEDSKKDEIMTAFERCFGTSYQRQMHDAKGMRLMLIPQRRSYMNFWTYSKQNRQRSIWSRDPAVH